MGKRKVDETAPQAVQDGINCDAVTTEDAVEPIQETAAPNVSDVSLKILLAKEAPLIFGNNPSAQEIEDFKKAYLEWLNK